MRNLIIALLSLLLIILMGTLGFKIIGGEIWSWLDALYMTIITITTTGFGETHPLSDTGRIFAMVVSLAGVGIFLYVLAVITQFIVAGELKEFFRRRKMKREIAMLKDHFILCGYGRMGKEVAQELKKVKLPLVIVDNDPKGIIEARQHGFLALEGDATHDDTLQEAVIERAKGFFSILPDDASNLVATLTARGLRPELQIVARSGSPETDSKLKRAGADKIISPYVIGGKRMVAASLKPTVVDFLDLVMHDQNLDIFLEEVSIPESSPWIGKPLSRLIAALEGEGTILSLCREERKIKRFISHQLPQHILNSGDRLVVLGTSSQLLRIQSILTEKAG